jgi:hypothetical protein
MSAFQGSSYEATIYLSLLDVPATSIAYSAVTLAIHKPGQSSFSSSTLLTANWRNLGNGIYAITFPSANLDTLGRFTYTLTGAGFDNFIFDSFDVEPVPLALLAQVDTCIVSGNIIDIGGSFQHRQCISARVPTFPAQAGTSLIAADPIKTYPDAFGNFQLVLIQGQTVIVEIENAGIYNQITVPMVSTANLLDLLPPIS